MFRFLDEAKDFVLHSVGDVVPYRFLSSGHTIFRCLTQSCTCRRHLIKRGDMFVVTQTGQHDHEPELPLRKRFLESDKKQLFQYSDSPPKKVITRVPKTSRQITEWSRNLRRQVGKMTSDELRNKYPKSERLTFSSHQHQSPQ